MEPTVRIGVSKYDFGQKRYRYAETKATTHLVPEQTGANTFTEGFTEAHGFDFLLDAAAANPKCRGPLSGVYASGQRRSGWRRGALLLQDSECDSRAWRQKLPWFGAAR